MSRSLVSVLHSRYGRPVSREQRREFLKTTLAASAGLMLSSCVPSALHRTGRNAGRRVVVIGAGFSGLACASEMVDAGYDVTVVEARSRVGGRVLSFNAGNGNEYVAGRNVEGGAELIGSNHPSWVAYSKRFKLDFIDMTEDDAMPPVVIDGTLLSDAEGRRLWEELEAALQLMNEDAKAIDADAPWKSPDAVMLDRRSTQEWIDALDVSALCKRAIWINQTSDNGQDASRQSYLGQLTAIKGGGLESYWTESEVYRCKGGNQQLAFQLAAVLGDRIVLGTPVTAVEADESVMRITCADGRTIECDDVVLTTPPGLWSKIAFRPELPAAMTPQMGLNSKYLAHVKDRFWQKLDPARSQYALSDGLLTMAWDGTDNQGPVENGVGGACLVGFSGGPPCEALLRMDKAARDAAVAEAFEQFFPGYRGQLLATRYMDWPNDPWAMASYSFPAPGQVTTVGPLMAQAHMNGRLHVAGEHTCYKFVGYMEGGLSSGLAVAKRIAVRDGIVSAAAASG